MFRIVKVIEKEVRQISRNRFLLVLMLIVPVIQLFVLSYAATFEVRHLPVIVVDFDRTWITREIISSLSSVENFDVIGYVDEFSSIDDLLEGGVASLVIVFPKNFERDILSLQGVELPIIIDGSDANSAIIAMNYMGNIVYEKLAEIVGDILRRKGISFAPRCVAEIRVWFNPEMRSSVFIVPGLIGMILITVTLIMTAMSVVREKEIGTIEQILVTSLKPYELIIGKIVPFIIIGLIDAMLIILVGRFWFKVPSVGSFPLLFISIFIFLMTTLGLGIFSSVISRTQQQALMTAYFFAMPNIILSGFIFPIESMPRLIQLITYLVPLRYFITILRGILLKGAGLDVLYPQILILSLFGTVILGFSIFKFKKYLE